MRNGIGYQRHEWNALTCAYTYFIWTFLLREFREGKEEKVILSAW